MKEIRKGAKLKRGMGTLISIVRGTRERKGFKDDSANEFGAFLRRDQKYISVKLRKSKDGFYLYRYKRECRGTDDSFSQFRGFLLNK